MPTPSLRGPARSLVVALATAVFVPASAQTVAATAAQPAPAGGPVAGFYRFPALRNGQLWFTAEGDLWRVPLTGGAAERVTTHPGAGSSACSPS